MGTKLNVSSACAYGSNRRRANKNTKMERKRRRFFIPVKVMSKVFRGKFLEYMKKEKLEYYKK